MTADEPQTRDQQKLYHSLIGEIAAQAAHMGAKWDCESWKRLLLDQFAKDTGKPRGRLIASLDGSGIVQVGIQSRKLSKAEAGEFVEWLYAWATDNGIELSDMEYKQ